MKKPNVFVIRISSDPVSMWFAGRTTMSWENAGYTVNIIEAATPKNMYEEYSQLTFAPMKLMGKTKRPFTETEKAVFYSHLRVLEIASRKASPSIIVEHDGECQQPWLPPSLYDHKVMPLCASWPAVGYYITASVARELCKTLYTTSLKGNLDYYVWKEMLSHNSKDEMNRYSNIVMHRKDPSVGNTIEHPDYEYARKSNDG